MNEYFSKSISRIILILVIALALVLPGCGKKTPPPQTKPGKPSPPTKTAKGTYKPYTIHGKTYYPLESAAGYSEEGYASWYGKEHHGKRTSNGESFNMYDYTAAHRILPMNTYLKVTNLENGRDTVVRINDRGPFVKDRIVDLTLAAANDLGMAGKGTARVRLEVVGEYENQVVPIAQGTYRIQVGAFSVYDNARALRDRFNQSGIRDVRILRSDNYGRVLWRVQVGDYNDLGLAENHLARIAQEFPDAFLIAD